MIHLIPLDVVRVKEQERKGTKMMTALEQAKKKLEEYFSPLNLDLSLDKKCKVMIDFEMDNDKDSSRGGSGNILYQTMPLSFFELEDLADIISDITGFLVYSIC